MPRLLFDFALFLAKALLSSFTGRRPPFEATAYFSLGQVVSDFSGLRNAVRRRGYLIPADVQFVAGGGGYGRRGQTLIGGTGSGGGGTLTDGRYQTEYGVGAGALLYGHVAYESGRLRMYQFVGAGGMGEGLAVVPKGEARSRSRGLSQPAAGAGGPAFRVGWAIEYRWLKWGSRGFVFGVHFGALVTPYRMRWMSRRFGNRPLPRIRFARPYVKLLLGVTVENIGAA